MNRLTALAVLVVWWAGGPGVASDTASLSDLTVAPEDRCSEYDRDDYRYPQSVELEIIARDGLVSPYTGETFASRDDSDIEHLVATAEAHDSGMCARTVDERRAFARDLDNLVLANPTLNRHEKRDKDAADWLPPMNQCWFAGQVVIVKAKYGLTVDLAERDALAAVLAGCEAQTARAPTPWGEIKGR